MKPAERSCLVSRKTKASLLPKPATYYPFASGRYNEKPNLFPFGKDFGNGKRDTQILQIDNQFNEYRAHKLRARKLDYSKYVCELESTTDQDKLTLNRLLSRIACSDYPEFFQKQQSGNGWDLKCSLSGEMLRFDNRDVFTGSQSDTTDKSVKYFSGLDALACQLQEDICVVKIDGSSEYLTAAHLCFPNRWAVSEKIGKNFIEIHKPVARFAEANPNVASLIQAMMGGRPYVRFAWGLSNDMDLDHHPDTTDEFRFESDSEALYLRVERQILFGLPQNNLLLFFIRTYYEDCREVCRDTDIAQGLAKTLLSMSDELLLYKGLSKSRDRIVDWLLTSR